MDVLGKRFANFRREKGRVLQGRNAERTRVSAIYLRPVNTNESVMRLSGQSYRASAFAVFFKHIGDAPEKQEGCEISGFTVFFKLGGCHIDCVAQCEIFGLAVFFKLIRNPFVEVAGCETFGSIMFFKRSRGEVSPQSAKIAAILAFDRQMIKR